MLGRAPCKNMLPFLTTMGGGWGSTTTPINLKVSSSSELLNFSLAAGGTFMLSTSEITSSLTNTFTYDNIDSVSVEPSGSNAKVEYFIATT